MGQDAALSRQMHRTLEPYHGMIYFVPEAQAEYARIGLTGSRMGYFASRAAPMGAVPADVVIATFFNFCPALVRRVIPAAWEQATPAEIIEARFRAADQALRRLLRDAVASPEIKEAAELARAATAGCFVEGRPLYAGHASLEWPEEPHLVLWHAQTLLREFRGDGHIAAMVTQGLEGIDALLIHDATGDLPAGILQASRAWPDDDWNAAHARLQARGWLSDEGGLTDDGRAARAWVETTTDELMLRCWEPLGEDACRRLRALVRPYSRVISEQELSRPAFPADE
ncbi:MAG TPA: hypothetical protein VL856_02910 [Acidimicrobiia bacterium]|nr:hypothetical protein [Acidimicrobiia bacterium]